MLRILRVIERQRAPRGFNSSYIRKVVYTVMIDEIRRVRARREVPLITEPRRLRTPPRDAGLAAHIDAGLATLVADRRAAVALYLRGHRISETARVLGWDVKRTENLVYRGLAQLRSYLAAQGIRP